MFFSSLLLLVTLSWSNPNLPPCGAEAFPAPEGRTDVVWEQYLNFSLQRCFRRFGDEVGIITVKVVDGQFSGIRPSAPEEKWGWELYIGRDFLNATDEPEDVLFILGHEVAHVFMYRDIGSFGEVEQDFIADLFVAHIRPNGACYGSRTLTWLLTQSDLATGERYAQEREWLRGRRSALIAQCALPVVLSDRGIHKEEQ